MKHLRKQDDHDYWKPCSPGTIMRVSDSKFQRQRRRFLIQSTMTGVVAATGLFSVIFALSHRRSNNQLDDANRLADSDRPNKNTETHRTLVAFQCNDIQNQLPQYVIAHRLDAGERNAEQADLMLGFEEHLDYCKSCQKMVADALA